MKKASILYLSINNVPSAKGILTGKVFEYMAVQRPVLCVGPKDGEINQLIPSFYCEFEDDVKIKSSILTLFENQDESPIQSIEDYSRENLTKLLIKYLN